VNHLALLSADCIVSMVVSFCQPLQIRRLELHWNIVAIITAEKACEDLVSRCFSSLDASF